jgi:hypothetical protein
MTIVVILILLVLIGKLLISININASLALLKTGSCSYDWLGILSSGLAKLPRVRGPSRVFKLQFNYSILQIHRKKLYVDAKYIDDYPLSAQELTYPQSTYTSPVGSDSILYHRNAPYQTIQSSGSLHAGNNLSWPITCRRSSIVSTLKITGTEVSGSSTETSTKRVPECACDLLLTFIVDQMWPKHARLSKRAVAMA